MQSKRFWSWRFSRNLQPDNSVKQTPDSRLLSLPPQSAPAMHPLPKRQVSPGGWLRHTATCAATTFGREAIFHLGRRGLVGSQRRPRYIPYRINDARRARAEGQSGAA